MWCFSRPCEMLIQAKVFFAMVKWQLGMLLSIKLIAWNNAESYDTSPFCKKGSITV